MEEQHGNYFIKRIQLIGRGAFGFVEHVKVYNLNKGECGDYARKVLAPEKPELLAQIEQFRRRFKRRLCINHIAYIAILFLFICAICLLRIHGSLWIKQNVILSTK